VPTKIWSSLSGGRKEEGGRRRKEEVTLIKSRDPDLAGREQTVVVKQ
jgi:hypothetical protein